MKQNIDIIAVVLSAFNHCLRNPIFSSILKAADITTLCKKANSTNKNSYTPISILPNILSYLKDEYIDKYQHILRVIFSVNINLDPGKPLGVS